jgi:hypothetical protein
MTAPSESAPAQPTPRVRVAVTVSLLLATSGIAGCEDDGGDERLTRTEWITEADKICRDQLDSQAEVEEPGFDPFQAELTEDQLRVAVLYLEKLLDLQEDATERLDELGLPKEGSGSVRRMLRIRSDGREELERSVAAARAGDVDRFQDRLERASGRFERAGDLAARFGLRACGQARRPR